MIDINIKIIKYLPIRSQCVKHVLPFLSFDPIINLNLYLIFGQILRKYLTNFKMTVNNNEYKL